MRCDCVVEDPVAMKDDDEEEDVRLCEDVVADSVVKDDMGDARLSDGAVEDPVTM